MEYLVRAIDSSRWLQPKLDQLPGSALTVDLQCFGDTWSMYSLEENVTKEKIERVVCQVFFDRPSCYEKDVTLVVFQSNELENKGIDVKSDPGEYKPVFQTTHKNIGQKLAIKDVMNVAERTLAICSSDNDDSLFVFGPKKLFDILSRRKKVCREYVKKNSVTGKRKEQIKKFFSGFAEAQEVLGYIFPDKQ